MFRQLIGQAYQEQKESEEVIPCVGGTVEVHKANRHPLPHPPCSSHGLLDDYDDVERVYREELEY